MVADSGFPTVQLSNRIDIPGGSVQSRVVASALKLTVKKVVNVWGVASHLPWPYWAVDHLGRLLRPVPGTSHHHVELPRCTAEATRPKSMETDRYVIYMHGGAFLVGGHYLHQQLISRIARGLSCEVLAPDYRQLTKYTIADSIEDCVDAYRHALAKGIPPERIAFMGDSAGAYLVFMTAIVAQQQGLPMPGAIVSMAPVIDFDLLSKLEAPSARTDAFFSKFFATAFHRFVLKHCTTPESRPMLTDVDLSGLPPSLIQVSDTELLYPDSVRLAAELANAGVSHELQVWQNQIHVFQVVASIVPEGMRAVGASLRFVESAFEVSRRAQTA